MVSSQFIEPLTSPKMLAPKLMDTVNGRTIITEDRPPIPPNITTRTSEKVSEVTTGLVIAE
ncbi:hypothetical protein D3C85_1506310 [compost metagenome]